MSKVILNGININYRTVGEGPDVVLVHGLAANHAFWSIEVLLKLTRCYRVTVFDLRGHGYSDMPTCGYLTVNMADDLLELMNHLNIEQANIVGHSFGGLVALQFATMHPDRVTSITIADTRVNSLQPTNCPRDWPNSEQALLRLRDLGIDIPEDEPDSGVWLLERLAQPEWREARDKLKGSPLFMPYGHLGGGAKSAERWLTLLNTTTARADFVVRDGPCEDDLRRLDQKVLAYYGQYSTLMPTLNGLKKTLPNCEVSIAERAGHFFPLSQPRVFITRVLKFLHGVATESAHREDLPLITELVPNESGRRKSPVAILRP